MYNMKKNEFASNCGAGSEGNEGFQSGNTCAGGGGSGEGDESPTSTPEKIQTDWGEGIELPVLESTDKNLLTSNIEIDGIKYSGSAAGGQEVSGNIGYTGFTKLMTADTFLTLSSPIEEGELDKGSVEFHKDRIKNGKPIGSLFMKIQWYEKEGIWTVYSHEGRHRATAIKEINPKARIPIYLELAAGLRARDLTDEMREANVFVPEDNVVYPLELIQELAETAKKAKQDRVEERIKRHEAMEEEGITPSEEYIHPSILELFGDDPEDRGAGDGGGSATSTPEFKSWFGDSKVVDSGGEPLVMYHGNKTGVEFDEFDLDFASKIDTDYPVVGFHFSSDLDDAELFATVGSGASPFFLSIKNPARHNDVRRAIQHLREERGIDVLDDPTLDGSKVHQHITDALKELGHDGFIAGWKGRVDDSIKVEIESGKERVPIKKRDGGTVYVTKDPKWDNEYLVERYSSNYGWEGGVSLPWEMIDEESAHIIAFDPTQIKSATDNKGTFDPDDPKITHKRKFAKKDAFDEMFDIFEVDLVESVFEAGVNQEALDDLVTRVPMMRKTVDQMASMAKQLAEEVVVAERAGILPFMESTSKGVQSALRRGFWVSEVDHNVVVNIQRLLGDAIRGVMPDETLDLPDFIDRARLEGAANLTDARLETIYRTNLSTAANEGTMSVLRDPEAQDLFPLVMISEIVDDRTRPHHAAMDGYITTPAEIDRLRLRPPNGYNCRGTLSEITWDEAEDEGLLDVLGKPDMVSIRRYNTPEQQALISSGQYPDEGFKYGGMM